MEASSVRGSGRPSGLVTEDNEPVARFFHPRQMVGGNSANKLSQGGLRVTLAEMRDLFGATGKHAGPLCEYLGMTRREGVMNAPVMVGGNPV